MINSNCNTSGIYRAFIIDADGDIRIFLPTLSADTDNCPIDSNNNLNMEVFKKNKETYPKPLWCIPNIEAKQHEQVHPCWVVFENGDINRPIVMGFLGKGIMYSVAVSESESNTSTNNTSTTTTNTNTTSSGDGSQQITVRTGDINSYFEYLKQHPNAKEHGPGSGTQCVELPNDYIEQAFGIKNNGGFGNGIDYSGNLANKYSNLFDKIDANNLTNLQSGDIVSMTSSTAAGHVVIIESVNGNKVDVAHQYNGSGNVLYETWTLSNGKLTTDSGKVRTIESVARPK